MFLFFYFFIFYFIYLAQHNIRNLQTFEIFCPPAESKLKVNRKRYNIKSEIDRLPRHTALHARHVIFNEELR